MSSLSEVLYNKIKQQSTTTDPEEKQRLRQDIARLVVRHIPEIMNSLLITEAISRLHALHPDPSTDFRNYDYDANDTSNW